MGLNFVSLAKDERKECTFWDFVISFWNTGKITTRSIAMPVVITTWQ